MKSEKKRTESVNPCEMSMNSTSSQIRDVHNTKAPEIESRKSFTVFRLCHLKIQVYYYWCAGYRRGHDARFGIRCSSRPMPPTEPFYRSPGNVSRSIRRFDDRAFIPLF